MLVSALNIAHMLGPEHRVAYTVPLLHITHILGPEHCVPFVGDCTSHSPHVRTRTICFISVSVVDITQMLGAKHHMSYTSEFTSNNKILGAQHHDAEFKLYHSHAWSRASCVIPLSVIHITHMFGAQHMCHIA